MGEVHEGRGRKPVITQEQIDQMINDTLHTTPPDATHWSNRTMAEHCGLSRTTVQREWKARGIKPHLVKTFKVSNDPNFEDKLIDVVGLYMNPPDGAIVLCFDEKSQIQALDRTQQSLPMKQGRPGTVTHDYKRHGTTTLFAALNVLTGELIGQCFSRHRHEEFLAFLRLINREVPRGKEIHVILDNYGTHKHPDVVAWLEKHKRFHFHFTPTSSSWLNMVERWFGDDHDQTDPAGQLRQRPRAHRSDRGLHRPPQRGPHPVHLDQDGQADHHQGPTWTGGPRDRASIARYLSVTALGHREVRCTLGVSSG